jgi:hypothetical protein
MDLQRQKRDEGAVTLMKYLFHQVFAVKCEIPPERRGDVTPSYFFGWLQQDPEGFTGMNAEEVIAAAKVPAESWELVQELFAKGGVMETFSQHWHLISLADRALPRHKLVGVNLNLVMTWADGTVCHSQVYMPDEMLMEPFSDGMVASILSGNAAQFIAKIVAHGLDGLHDMSPNLRGNTPEDPFEVMMGVLIQHLRGEATGKQLRDDLREPVEKYVRLAQELIRPVIPPQVRKQIEEAKRAALRDKGKTREGKAHGGWDIPAGF